MPVQMMDLEEVAMVEVSDHILEGALAYQSWTISCPNTANYTQAGC